MPPLPITDEAWARMVESGVVEPPQPGEWSFWDLLAWLLAPSPFET